MGNKNSSESGGGKDDAPLCPGNHDMHYFDGRARAWQCDLCGGTWKKNKKDGFTCTPCGFDVCPKCAKKQRTESQELDMQVGGVIYQYLGKTSERETAFWHMVQTKSPEFRGGISEEQIVDDFEANNLRLPALDTEEEMDPVQERRTLITLHCRDMLEKMSQESAGDLVSADMTKPCCPKLHPLKEDSGFSWICDRCWAHRTSETRMRCSVCDYDLCVECYKKEEAKGSDLKKVLSENPHFPQPELDLLPVGVVTEIKLDFNPSTFHASTYLMVEKISCGGKAHQARLLEQYQERVPPDQRNLSIVVLEGTTSRFGRSTWDRAEIDVVVEIVSPLFGGTTTTDSSNNNTITEEGSSCARKRTTAHTLVLRNVKPELVVEFLKAQLPGLACLVLEDCGRLEDVLPLLVSHPVVEEVPLVRGPVLTGAVADMLRLCTIPFVEKSDLSVPPPKVAAKLAEAQVPLSSSTPLRLTQEAFSRVHPDEHATLGLVLPCVGQQDKQGEDPSRSGSSSVVIPLRRDKMHRFLLLPELLQECDDSDRLVPIDMQPPISPESLELAVHFVTHYVTDVVHGECTEKEARLVVTNKDDPRYFWNQDFQQFRSAHLNERFPDPWRRVQVLCELMALAAYLNCPTLKRFVRAALVT